MTKIFKISLILCLLLPSPFSGQEIGEAIGSFKAQGVIFGSPAIGHDGSIYFGSQDNAFYGLNPDGTQKWKFTGATDWIDSSPTLTNEGLVIFGSWDNRLYALDSQTGTLRWSFTTGNLINSSASVDQSGNIVFGSFDSFVYSLTPEGEERWATPVIAPIEGSGVIGPNDTYYIGDTSGYLYAINMNDGSIKWSFRVEDVYNRIIGDRIDFISSPALSDDGVLYIGCKNGFLYAIDINLPASTSSADRLFWSFQATDQIESSPIIAENGDVLFAARDGYLYRLNDLGVIQWDEFVGDVFLSSPAIDINDNAYIIGYKGTATGVSSQLVSVNASGDRQWTFDFPALNDSSVTIAPDGSIYFGGYDGVLYQIKSDARLSLSEWPKINGNRTNQNNAPMATDLDALDFYPNLSPYDKKIVANGSNEIINTTHFPFVYSNQLGWIECVSIDTTGTIFLHNKKTNWLSPLIEDPQTYFHYPTSNWLILQPNSSAQFNVLKFINLSNGLSVQF